MWTGWRRWPHCCSASPIILTSCSCAHTQTHSLSGLMFLQRKPHFPSALLFITWCLLWVFLPWFWYFLCHQHEQSPCVTTHQQQQTEHRTVCCIINVYVYYTHSGATHRLYVIDGPDEVIRWVWGRQDVAKCDIWPLSGLPVAEMKQPDSPQVNTLRRPNLAENAGVHDIRAKPFNQ